MNSLEINALSQPLSNEARVLYCLYLRPLADASNTGININNKLILALLNGHQPRIQLGREISALFEELHQVGLINIVGDYSFNRSLNNHAVLLPLSNINVDLEDVDLHQQHQKMSLNWRPNLSLFTQVCQLVGVIEAYFDADELGEFIAYWLGRPEVLQTPYQWTQKFVLHLKQRRIRTPAQGAKSKVGHQWVEPKAGIEFDDNVKKLVQKYSEK
ncbi:DnaT-like ssDNA-binding domain-containing protein [Glaciecola sp. SC05]|uniref:DnaT-like ssDNA-binding domain-containing protein n=1 Tax=Glaciecola sp. SC05 TaxID=1987355 RepID=UPI0035270965